MLVACTLALAGPWHGSINEAFEAADPPRLAAPFDLSALAGRLHATVDPDLAALPDTVSLLYGDPASHPALAQVLAWHHIALDAGGVTLGDVRIAQVDPFLIAALPNPLHPERPVVVYTAWQGAAQPTLNRVFHGPTALVVGGTTPLEATWSGDWRVDPAGRLVGPAIGQPVLSAADAREDLRVLNDQLVRGWAGLEDLDAQLGGGWAEAVAAADTTLAGRERWSWEETWDVLAGLLAPVRDVHFSVQGGTITPEGRPVVRSARFDPHWRPRFADGRLTGSDGAWTFDGAPLPEAPPPVPGPHEVQLGTAYRFPTLLADGRPAWLLGAFLTGPEGTIQVGGRTLALHPARGANTGGPAWALEEEVLAVRTMREAQLEGMVETARALRHRDRVVLDLRGNGGGADRPAQRWTTRLHPGPYRWTPGADLTPGDAPRPDRRRTWDASTLGRPATRRTAFDGWLQVLIDGRVASSGETFVQLAAQVPGAVLYGGPTAGCSRYGNLVTQAPLPHTRIVATFGHTAFDWDSVRPTVEGVGIFPDVWLDEVDPLAFVRGLPRPGG